MPFPLEFQLETNRCRLRLPNETDFPHIFSATRIVGFNDGMPWEPPSSTDELRAPLQRTLEAWTTGQGYSFTIEAKDGSEFFGRISIRKTSHPSIWNIGFWLHPTCQRKGLMTEAACAVVEWGFEQLHADAIEACYAVWNIQSRRVLDRLGMLEIEFIPEGFKKRGEWVNEHKMRVSRNNWRNPNRTTAPTPASVTLAEGQESRPQ